MESPQIKRALISVSDKTGLTDFGQGLSEAGVEIFSTGGTARHLKEHGITVVDISDYTGFPEMMDGRLKTLHPKVFGGILCRHDHNEDMASIGAHEISSFELVVVNLYPFEQTVAREGVTMPEAIEQIDIGGPSLVRAAAKNHKFTTIATSPQHYAQILNQITTNGETSIELRRQLAGDAFTRTAEYDSAISNYFAKQLDESDDPFAQHLTLRLSKQSSLRYGENPHQNAALYSDGTVGALLDAKQLNGKELSYNNLLDLDAAFNIAKSLPRSAAAVVKHNNPCGAASAESLSEAAANAMAGDPVSAFGSIVGFNRRVDAKTADVLAEPGLFVEAIVAPEFDDEALKILTTKPKWKNNVRLMATGVIESAMVVPQFRQIDGGMLIQDSDTLPNNLSDWKVVTETQPNDKLMAELQFGWSIVRHVKSNAITVSRDYTLWGAGAGQMSRVDSVEISLEKAGEKAKGAVLASDAFFPFPDSIERAAQAGIAAVIQPGGSKRDQEVIDACHQHGIPMVFTNRRHFRH